MDALNSGHFSDKDGAYSLSYKEMHTKLLPLNQGHLLNSWVFPYYPKGVHNRKISHCARYSVGRGHEASFMEGQSNTQLYVAGTEVTAFIREVSS